MNVKQSSRIVLLVIITFTFSFLIGCQEAKEEAESIKEKVEGTELGEELTSSPDSLENVAGEVIEDIVYDLKGTWSGKFDKRSTTLKILEQDGNDFSGKITIRYRNVINQEVTGMLNPETDEIIMKDMLHSRYRGSYKGKLSDDMNTFSGIFTIDVDGKKLSFSLTKDN